MRAVLGVSVVGEGRRESTGISQVRASALEMGVGGTGGLGRICSSGAMRGADKRDARGMPGRPVSHFVFRALLSQEHPSVASRMPIRRPTGQSRQTSSRLSQKTTRNSAASYLRSSRHQSGDRCSSLFWSGSRYTRMVRLHRVPADSDQMFHRQPTRRDNESYRHRWKSRHPTLEVVFVLHVAPKIREVPAPFVPLKIKLPIRREDGNLLTLDSDVISPATYPSPPPGIQFHEPRRMIDHAGVARSSSFSNLRDASKDVHCRVASRSRSNHPSGLPYF